MRRQRTFMGLAFGTVVKASREMAASCVGIPRSELWLCSSIQFLVHVHSSRTMTPVIGSLLSSGKTESEFHVPGLSLA